MKKKASKAVSKPVKITASKIIKEVRRLAREYPEAVYCSPAKGCNNIRGKVMNGPEQPGCIVGQACANVGADPIVLKKNAEKGSYSLLAALDVEWTSKQGNWLGSVQAAQDRGISWGKSLTYGNQSWPGVR